MENLEHPFVRVNPMGESKHRAEVALEWRNSLDLAESAQPPDWCCSVILCFPFSALKVSPSWCRGWRGCCFVKSAPGRCFGIFTPLRSVLVEVAVTAFWGVLSWETWLRDEVQLQVASPAWMPENHPPHLPPTSLTLIRVIMMFRSDVSLVGWHVDWEFSDVARQLSRYNFSRIKVQAFCKFYCLPFLSASPGLVTVARPYPFFFSVPDLAAEHFLLYTSLLEYLADWEYLPVPLTGFSCNGASPLWGFGLGFFILATNISLGSDFFSLVAACSAFSPTVLQDGKRLFCLLSRLEL